MDGYGLAPLEGGFSGETFLAEAAGERTVVRIYAERGSRRGPTAVEIDAAVLGLVRGLVPVPDVVEVRRPDAGAGTPGLLVTSFLPGTRLDLLLPDLGPDGRATVGHRLGVLLARLAQMPMVRTGAFADRDLRIEPFPPALADLVSWVESQREDTALAEWPGPEYDALLAVADRAQEILDGIDRACLVHSDFNPKNLLVDPGTLEVTGVLDWEFAHAGLPGSDLGNLLRLEREPLFADAVLDAYAERIDDLAGADHRAALLDAARAADLFALVELAGRRGANPVAARAHDQLRAIAHDGHHGAQRGERIG